MARFVQARHAGEPLPRFVNVDLLVDFGIAADTGEDGGFALVGYTLPAYQAHDNTVVIESGIPSIPKANEALGRVLGAPASATSSGLVIPTPNPPTI